MLMQLICKSVRVLADFRASWTLKFVRDGLMQGTIPRKFVRQDESKMQNLHELVAIVSN